MALQVLICDDSRFAQRQIARALPADWDINVMFAGNGEEALAAVRNGQADLMFLDLNMPTMDGYQVLQCLRQEDLPCLVFVVSGDIQPQARARVKKLGAIDFIRKPIDMPVLTRLLSDYGLYNRRAPVDANQSAPELPVTTLDICQELANVAMGRAAELLARVLNTFVVLPVPKVNLIEVSELTMLLQATQHQDTLSAVSQGFIGSGIAGEALLLFYDSSYTDIAKLLNHGGELTPQHERELLMDIANILIGASLGALAEQLNLRLSQGHPVILGQHSHIDALIRSGHRRWQKTLAIELNYTIEGHDVCCDLLLLFTEDSLASLEQRTQYLLEQTE